MKGHVILFMVALVANIFIFYKYPNKKQYIQFTTVMKNWCLTLFTLYRLVINVPKV